MKLLLLALALASSQAFAYDIYVQGYTRSNGHYVQGYERTAPDSTRANNYSTTGNVNPYTGSYGTHSYEPSATTTVPTSQSWSWNK